MNSDVASAGTSPGGSADTSSGWLVATRLDRWWKPKAVNLLAIFYWVILVTAIPFQTAIHLLLPAVCTILGIGCFGHFVNDLFDRETDLRAGKPNRMILLQPAYRVLLLAGAAALALVPWIFLPRNLLAFVLLALEFALLLAYAVPPIRLKERRVWAVFADGAYAYAIPSLLAANTYFLSTGRSSEIYFALSLFLWQLLYGMRHYLNHLALDRTNDIQTGTRTLATEKGNAFVHRLIRTFLLPGELLFLAVFLYHIGPLPTRIFLVLAALFVAFTTVPLLLAVARKYPLLTYRFSGTGLDVFYQDGWPLVPLLFLVLRDGRFGILAAAHVVLFYPFVFRYCGYIAGIFLLPIVRSKRRARPGSGVPAGPRVPAGPTPATVPGAPETPAGNGCAIVVANINKGKYTETFINELVPLLKYKVHYIYGGELPEIDGEGRRFLSDNFIFQLLIRQLEQTLRLGKDHFLKNSIANYFQARRIRLVLAEFGPVGAAIYPISRNTGLPLIVCFHGYDAFNQVILDLYGQQYRELFREAKKIVVVSETMVDRLVELGAPRDKLVHLPAYVNLQLFPYSDHSLLPPRFLAVGRFAETKSPHLTILAFHRVSLQVPDATLTFVGRGGGGDLLEACMILVRALGLGNSVFFKGRLDHEGVAAEMRQARIFVQHSLTTPETGDREGKPVAIMEAMACGLPVVSTRHSGIPELIEEGSTGLLVNEYDIGAMADAMLLLLQEPSLARSMGLRASEQIRAHPLVSRHLFLLEQLIDDCMAI